MAQIVGVIVLALGLPAVFHSIAEGTTLDNAVAVASYVVMTAPATGSCGGEVPHASRSAHPGGNDKCRHNRLRDVVEYPWPCGRRWHWLTVVGAYVLASKLAASSGDHVRGLAAYEQSLRPPSSTVRPSDRPSSRP